MVTERWLRFIATATVIVLSVVLLGPPLARAIALLGESHVGSANTTNSDLWISRGVAADFVVSTNGGLGPLHHIAVSPSNPSVPAGGSQTFTAQGYDQGNNPLPGETVTWSVTDATAGSIDSATGVFTAGSAPGDYPDVIHATSGTVIGTASVTVFALQGDVNGDGAVDLADLVTVAAAFGSTTGSPHWNPAADLNSDGVVNIMDLTVVGLNFGRHG